MRGEARRRFTLLDAMALVAATAVGIALARGYVGAFRRSFVGNTPSYGVYRFWAAAASPCLTAWGLTLTGFRRLTPGRRWVRFIRQPGTAACLATTMGAGSVALLGSLSYYHMTHSGQEDIRLVMFAMNLAPSIAPAVAIAWLMIWSGGRWRRSADRIDAAGRALGLGWFVLYLTSQLRWVV